VQTRMEHTKKFVLVDPLFVKPSMRDKALSGLDTDISNILKSEEPDEVKVRNYMTALSRYKIYSTPEKPAPAVLPPSPPPTPAIPSVPATAVPATVPPAITFKITTPSKRSGKRIKIEPLQSDPSLDQQLWRRTQRARAKKQFGSQWIAYSETPRSRKKSRSTWIEQ
jgi:hypothetical protein